MTVSSRKPSEQTHWTIDDFLGGKLRMKQPREGYRIAMDTVLLAACVPARPGERVMDAGVGTGGAALCLARRVPGVAVTGVDIQPQMLAVAEENAIANDLAAQLTLSECDIRNLEGRAGSFDHVMINPPFLADGHAIRPPEENKGRAHMELETTIKDWVRFALYHCRHKGTISFVFRSDRLDSLIHRLYGRVGDLRLLPLWPRTGEPPKRIILQGRKGTRGAMQILPGLALHGARERYSAEARKILWDGGAIDMKIFAEKGERR